MKRDNIPIQIESVIPEIEGFREAYWLLRKIKPLLEWSCIDTLPISQATHKTMKLLGSITYSEVLEFLKKYEKEMDNNALESNTSQTKNT